MPEQWTFTLNTKMPYGDKVKFISLGDMAERRMAADCLWELPYFKRNNRAIWELLMIDQDKILDQYLIKGV